MVTNTKLARLLNLTLTTVPRTHQPTIAVNKHLLRATGLYLVTGLSILIVVDAINHPHNVLLSLLGLISNLVFFSNKYYVLGSWVLIFTLSLMFLPYLPFMVARTFRLSHIPLPTIHHRSWLEMSSGFPENFSSRSMMQQQGHSGILGGNKGMIMVADGKIMFVNKEFCQLSGFSPAEVIGRDFIEFIHRDDLLRYTNLIRTTETGSHDINGIAIRSGNQSELEVYIAGSRNTVSNPNDICLFYVRERSSATARKLSSSDWMIHSLGNSNMGFWIWDEKGMIYINEKCRILSHVSLGLVMNKPLFIFKAVEKPDRKAVVEAYQKYLKDHIFDEEIPVIEGEQKKWYRVMLSPALDEKGNLVHHTGMAYDITDQHNKMEELESACTEAVTANYNKTAFLANMSHEIRSPLNGILGFSELLADPDLGTIERERYIEIIKNNGIALLSILTDIIDISKLEAGKMKIQEKEFRPGDLMDELQLQFARDPLLTHKGLTLEWLISDEIANARVISDSFRVRQILVNLITNALKFTEAGRVEVGSERWDTMMVFWVQDTGVGISEENLKMIFDRYRQVAKTQSTNTSGFGLGLAISKMLVELLGGHIWVESEAGQGTVFYFTIPYSTPKQTEMNNTNSGETAFPYDWKGRTILIAEDIDFSFLYIEAVLRRTGAKVLWAQNGREAIDMVKVNPGIDIALMDIHMPIMNGYDATREIMKIRPDLPVIAQTAFVLPDDVKACYAAGCAGYLAKPIRREQLLNTLTDYFEKIDQNAQIESGNMPVYRSKISG